MKMNGAEITIRLLERQGVSIVTGIPGGGNLPLYRALASSSIRHVLARHEQGAGFIAQGMARATGRTAVCFATSGPGVTNLITALADAKLDSVPVVAITGQVALDLMGTDAFQEVDTYGLTLPVTKHNFLARSAEELLRVVPGAFAIAASGRPGPVVVDIPKNVQTETIEVASWPEPGRRITPGPPDAGLIDEAARMIDRSKRPVLYAGGGIVSSGTAAELGALAQGNSIPVAMTLMGLGSFPCDDPLSLGMLGMHGARHTNHVLEEADLLVALGARFDDRATGVAREFCRRAEILHVDIDRAEIDKIRGSSLSIAADLRDVMGPLVRRVMRNPRPEWMARVREIAARYPRLGTRDREAGHPAGFIDAVRRRAGEAAVVTTDVGQHQMWVAQHYGFSEPRQLLTSGGLGTMGFGIPAAIGAALARPDRTVLCFAGDGSFYMNMQELATLRELGLDVKVFVMNNGGLGLVRQQQELFYGGIFIASDFGFAPDFAAIAETFGIRGCRMDAGDPDASIRDMLARPGPALMEVPVRGREMVYPMVPPGAANRDMLGGGFHE